MIITHCCKYVSTTGSWRTLDQLRAGEILAGKIKRVEKFGCFVALEGTPLSGLAHISECADEFIKDLGEKFTVGDRVKYVFTCIIN